MYNRVTHQIKTQRPRGKRCFILLSKPPIRTGIM